MTRFDPTLVVTRLVVERNDRVAYDEHFHVGVNIIRGENSSGKSTVLNFVYYGLGGDLFDWSEVALLCTRVLVEVELNGKPATLSRNISTQRSHAMEIYGGNYEDARTAARDEWIRYPYARSQSRESFSQSLFRLLDIPEVASDISGNVTMHQILRLLYADQLSPVGDLFRLESFDSPVLRDIIGRLLCGAYDSALYDNELRIRALQKEFDSVSGELRSLFAVIGTTDQVLTLEWIDGQRQVLEQERHKLQKDIEEAEKHVYSSAEKDELTLKAQEAAYGDVQMLQAELGRAHAERDSLAFNIADSDKFIATLESKIVALKDSALVAEHIGDVQFKTCPACLAPIEVPDGSVSLACHLCKTPFNSDRTKARIAALINDSAIQLKQSRQLQMERTQRYGNIDNTLRELREKWEFASRRLAELQRLPSSEARERLRTLHHQAGYLERQIENLGERVRIVEMIDRLSKKKTAVNEEIARLRAQNDVMRASQEDRLSKAHTAIADEIRVLLRNDLRRQDSFENPKSIQFDFAANRISVDEQTYFSASSRVILKSSFFLGFLAAATKHQFFRHPRFCIIDTMEDKGMEPQRSHNFQMQVARVSAESKVTHQVIFATAMIAPDLDNEQYTIGQSSTRDHPTIRIAG